MIGKARTDVLVLIESQYEFLDYLIKDVAQRYYKNYMAFDDMAEKESRDVSGGDIDVYHSYLKSFEEELYRQYDFVIESRKTIFISIYSYLEMVLNEMVYYYHIVRDEYADVEKIIKSIKKNYNKDFKKKLGIPNEIIIKEFYSLLRNYYVHGRHKIEDKKRLKYYASINDKIDSCFNIIDDTFLSDALNNVYNFLMTIVSAFDIERKNINQ